MGAIGALPNLEVILVIRLIVLSLIAYDMYARQDFSNTQTILILLVVVLLPILGPVLYILLVYSQEASGREKCPVCGGDKPVDGECSECGFSTDYSHLSEEEKVEDPEESGVETRKVQHTDVEEGSDEEHEEETREPESFRCDRCGKTFDTWRGLKTHKARQHADEQSTTSDEEEQESESGGDGLRCEECGRTFATVRGLHIHQAQKHE